MQQVADNLTYDQGAPGYTEALRSSATSQALIVLYMGVGSLLGSFVFMIAFNYTGESISRRLRVRYFQVMLGHDFEFFDRIGTGEMTSRMMGDLGVIQEALSEKLPLTFVYLSNFVAGFVVAFAFQWKLALSLLAMLPCIFASFTIAKVSFTSLTSQAALLTCALVAIHRSSKLVSILFRMERSDAKLTCLCEPFTASSWTLSATAATWSMKSCPACASVALSAQSASCPSSTAITLKRHALHLSESAAFNPLA